MSEPEETESGKFRSKKEEELAHTLNISKSTVQSAQIPLETLSDIHRRATRGEKFAKFLRTPGKYATFGSVAATAAALTFGPVNGTGFDGLAFALTSLFLGASGTAIGGVAWGTGAALDRRKPIKRTVNMMALSRLEELEHKQRYALPAPEDKPAPKPPVLK